MTAANKGNTTSSALSDSTFVSQTVARLFDFFQTSAPWHRRLWGIGTVLGLNEVVEYSRIQREGGLSPQGVQYVATTMLREIHLDPASKPFADEISKKLKKIEALKDKGQHLSLSDEHQLQHLVKRVDDGYLERLVVSLASAEAPQVERTARLIASHMLDRGFSPDHLYRWVDKDRYNNESPDLERILDSAIEMNKDSPNRIWEVIVPCSCPGLPSELPSGIRWMEAREASDLIEGLKIKRESPRIDGAFLLNIAALDPWAAIDSANDLVARIGSRISVGRAGDAALRTSGIAYVVGRPREFKLSRSGRQLEIHSLGRQGAIFGLGEEFAQLDDAIELASYLETGTPGAAITGGWAAIEGLLLYPNEGNHVMAADRLARIITCSLARAEMTSLVYKLVEEGGSPLAESIQSLNVDSTNYQKVSLLERHLRQNGHLEFCNPSDQAALDRVKMIISNPTIDLERIRLYFQASMRRLYNQRNLIMHGGSFRSVALKATLRTTPSLVGAGLDRIAHAQLRDDQPLRPLELAARAESELSLIGAIGSSRIVDLLGA